MHLANYQSAFAGSTFAFDQTFTRANYLTADSLSGNAIASMLLGAATSGEVDYIAQALLQLALLCAVGAGRYQSLRGG